MNRLERLDRRAFLRGMMVTSAGLLVPKPARVFVPDPFVPAEQTAKFWLGVLSLRITNTQSSPEQIRSDYEQTLGHYYGSLVEVAEVGDVKIIGGKR